MHTRVMYHALHESGHAKKYIIQDLFIPWQRGSEFVEYIDREMGTYPLWLCPKRQNLERTSREHSFVALDTDKVLVVGVWGPGPKSTDAFVALNKRLERKVRELRGMKWLYAQTYYTEDEFWSIYDRKWYDALRTKYRACGLPSVYDKVRVEYEADEKAVNESWPLWLKARFWDVWPLSGIYGVYKTMVSKEYLLREESAVVRPCELLPHQRRVSSKKSR